MLKLVQMWIKLQIRAKIREKGGLGFFRLAIGFRKCLMPHDCCSFRGDIHASNSALARVALIEFLGLFLLIGANEKIGHLRQNFHCSPREHVEERIPFPACLFFPAWMPRKPRAPILNAATSKKVMSRTSRTPIPTLLPFSFPHLPLRPSAGFPESPPPCCPSGPRNLKAGRPGGGRRGVGCRSSCRTGSWCEQESSIWRLWGEEGRS